jgi:hypothetical protein
VEVLPVVSFSRLPFSSVLRGFLRLLFANAQETPTENLPLVLLLFFFLDKSTGT